MTLIALSGTVSAANNTTGGENQTEVKFLAIVWPTEAGQLVQPMQQIQERYPNVEFRARSTTQAVENISEIPGLVEWADVIYLSNIQPGILTETLLNLRSQGKLDGKVIASYPSPYFSIPAVRLSNFAGVEFLDANGTPLTDMQIQQIFSSISYPPMGTTSMAMVDLLKARYPAMADYLEVKKYYVPDTASPENRARMLEYILAKSFPDRGFNTTPPVPVPQFGLYRNGRIYTNFTEYASLYLDPDRRTIGITAWSALTYERSDLRHLDAMIESLERCGLNALPLISQSNMGNGMYEFAGIRNYFIDMPTSKSRVDAIISLTWLVGGETSKNMVNSLIESYGILIVPAFVYGSDIHTWEIDGEGLGSASANVIALKETQGQIMPMVIGVNQRIIDPRTGIAVEMTLPLGERVERLASRLAAWSRLRELPNADKRIGLIYYNYPPGKQGLAGADSLNGPESIFEILRILDEAGYTVERPESVDALLEIMMRCGRNIGTWAPGELEALADNAVLYPVDEFMEWYMKLPESTRKQMEEGPMGYIESVARKVYGVPPAERTADLMERASANLREWYRELRSTLESMNMERKGDALRYLDDAYSALQRIINHEDRWNQFYTAKNGFMGLNISGLSGWGPAPGNVMTVERNGTRYFVLPVIRLGNIYLGAQPQRTYEDADMLYHSTVIPPTYQYLAFYAYLQRNIDAAVYLGRHGTYEWLPGRESGQGPDDYTDICTGSTPVVYLYTMDGVGEALHAKRRGMAVIISHLIQPLAPTALDDEMMALKTLTERYLSERNEALIPGIIELASKMHLDGFINLTARPERFVDEIHDYLVELQNSITPLGLHVFGREWSFEKTEALVMTMAAKIASVPAGASRFITPAEALNNITNGTGTVIAAAFSGGNWTAALRDLAGRDLTEEELLAADKVASYVMKIKQSPERESSMLLRALNGLYIPPSLGNDPVRTPDALPTGGNLYGLDPQKLPYWDAYLRGCGLVNETLAACGEIPEQLGVVLWATETQRDNGATIAFILRLLGVEPVYAQQAQRSGNVIGIRAVPLAELSRPRVDVLVTISGILRETFPHCTVLLDRAVRVSLAASYSTLVSEINRKPVAVRNQLMEALEAAVETIRVAGLFVPGNDPLEMNHVARHWLSDTEYLIGQNISGADAGRVAVSRIFGPPIGEWGASGVRVGVQLSETWDDRLELGDAFIADMKYSYREDDWGGVNGGIFTLRLRDISGIYHSRSDTKHGVLDLDHNYEFLGGFNLAVERLTGRRPELFILNQVNPGKPRVESLSEFITRDLHTKFFNREWISAMMKEGYAGASYISGNFFENLWGWKVTVPHVITDSMWNDAVDIYIRDRYGLGVNEWLRSGKNAYSMISITGTLLTAASKGYWNADQDTLRMLADLYVSTVNQYSVACCHHTCGNIQLNKWILKLSSLNTADLESFMEKFSAATGMSLAADGGVEVPDVNPGRPGESANPSRPAVTAGASEGGKPSSSVSGKAAGEEVSQSSEAGQNTGKAYEVAASRDTGSGSTETPLYAIVGIISIVALLGAGYLKGIKFN